MSSYAGAISYPVTILRPDDGLSRSVATVNPAFEALADRTAFLAHEVGGTETHTIAQADTTYTMAAFAAWQTFGRVVLDVNSASGPDVAVHAPLSAKDGDILEIVIPANSPGASITKNLVLDAGDFGHTALAPYLTVGSYRFRFDATIPEWVPVGSRAVWREGWVKKYGHYDNAGLAAALAGVVNSTSIDTSKSPLLFKDGDTICARVSGTHFRNSVAPGADDTALVYTITLKRNGVEVVQTAYNFPNEETNRQMFSGYSSQKFPVIAEIFYKMNHLATPLSGAWTVDVEWYIAGGSQVLNSSRSYVLNTVIEVQRGCDF